MQLQENELKEVKELFNEYLSCKLEQNELSKIIKDLRKKVSSILQVDTSEVTALFNDLVKEKDPALIEQKSDLYSQLKEAL